MALTDCCFGKAFQQYLEKVGEADGWGWQEVKWWRVEYKDWKEFPVEYLSRERWSVWIKAKATPKDNLTC